jgi:hypothetical protein
MSPLIPLLTCVLLSGLALIEFTTRPAQLLVSSSILLGSVATAWAMHRLLARSAVRVPTRTIAVATFLLPVSICVLYIVTAF